MAGPYELVDWWDCGPYLYQLWDTGIEYVFHCVDNKTLDLLCVGQGNTPLEAVTEGIREALRVLS